MSRDAVGAVSTRLAKAADGILSRHLVL